MGVPPLPFPADNCIKYNTDGASRGNPGVGSYKFCLRDHRGDTIYAECKAIEDTTNICPEAKAILVACKYCKQSNCNHASEGVNDTMENTMAYCRVDRGDTGMYAEHKSHF